MADVSLSINIGSLILLLIVMSVFVLLGRMAERSSHFIWPHDFFSALIYIIATVLLLVSVYVQQISWLPWELVVTALIGYVVGFLASGYRQYIHLLDIHAGTRSATMPYIVPYKVGNVWYLQLQSTKEHAKRVLFGINSPIETNGDLRSTWQWSASHPYFPIPALYCLPVEVVELDRHEIVRKDRWIKCKKYNPLILIAPASMCTKLDLIKTMEAHEQDVRANNTLTAELIQTKHSASRRAMAEITSTVSRALYDDSPAAMLMQINDKQRKSSAPVVDPEVKRKMLRIKRRRDDGQQ